MGTIRLALMATPTLQDFYQEVANPLLTSVTFEYPKNAVEEVTQNNFRLLFKGSEMVVAGKLREQSPDVLAARVSGQLVSVAGHPAGHGQLGHMGRGLVQTPALLGSSWLTLGRSQSALCHLRTTLSSRPGLPPCSSWRSWRPRPHSALGGCRQAGLFPFHR